jgi:hypothetical protein
MDKRTTIAKAIVAALRENDPMAWIKTPGARDGEPDDLSNVGIDGNFDMLAIADAVLAALGGAS